MLVSTNSLLLLSEQEKEQEILENFSALYFLLLIRLVLKNIVVSLVFQKKIKKLCSSLMSSLHNVVSYLGDTLNSQCLCDFYAKQAAISIKWLRAPRTMALSRG